MKLTILIASVHTRRNTFLPRILENVYSQYEKLTTPEQDQVEILLFMDNKKMMLGDKRNLMIEQAQGEYVTFVDDDDVLSEDYISSILKATQENSDIITFQVVVTLNGGEEKICHYSKDYDKDYNLADTYHRLPNHICVVKRDIARTVQFPSVLYGEDSAYAKLLKPLLKSQTIIDKVLYSYIYNTETTETQMNIRTQRNYHREHVPSFLDLVILSNAKDDYFKGLTEQTIKTAVENAHGYKINVIVMEQNKEVSYPETTIHYDGEFNYNKLANQGAKTGDAPYIMIANNDLIFKEDWLFELLLVNEPVVSPKCPVDVRQSRTTENSKGIELIKNFSGWCFMVKRTVWEQIEGFDEDFCFWFADNATIRQLEEKGYQSMLVVNSLVEHLGSQTLKTLSSKEKIKITTAQAPKYNKKYDEHHFER